MKLIEYVRSNAGRKSPNAKAEEEQIYQLLKADPTLTIAKLAKKTGIERHNVQSRLDSMSRQGRIKYVRMWVPLEEIDGSG